MPDPAKYGVFHYPLTATAVTPQSRLELSESASCHVWSVGLTRGVIPSHPFTQPCDPSVVVLPSDCWGCQSHCVTRWLERWLDGTSAWQVAGTLLHNTATSNIRIRSGIGVYPPLLGVHSLDARGAPPHQIGLSALGPRFLRLY